jgi:hypothetical protein
MSDCIATVPYVQRKDDEEERVKSAAKRAQDEAARSTSSVDLSVNDDVLETIRKAEEARDKERARRDGKADSSSDDKPKFNSEIVRCASRSMCSHLAHIAAASHCHPCCGALTSWVLKLRPNSCRPRSWRWASGWLSSRTRRRRAAGRTPLAVRLSYLDLFDTEHLSIAAIQTYGIPPHAGQHCAGLHARTSVSRTQSAPPHNR